MYILLLHNCFNTHLANNYSEATETAGRLRFLLNGICWLQQNLGVTVLILMMLLYVPRFMTGPYFPSVI